MSKRGMDYLELWMAANVKAGGDAVEFARRCLAEALRDGISAAGIKEEAKPLAAFIASTLVHVTDGGSFKRDVDDRKSVVSVKSLRSISTSFS